MKLSIVILSFAILVLGCKKNNIALYKSRGIITGYDLRLCQSPECGGLLITITNDTAKNPPLFYHINSTLTQLGIGENAKLPINVSLNYKPDTGIYLTYHYILVTQIKVIN